MFWLENVMLALKENSIKFNKVPRKYQYQYLETFSHLLRLLIQLLF